MTFKPKYVAAASCILVMVVIASTAGCTSSSTSSNKQASTAASNGQAASGYPADTAGSDPNPSVVPRYNPSQRSYYVDYPDHGWTGYNYKTKDTVSQVSSFYKTQMQKLGYTMKVEVDRPDHTWIMYQKNGKTVVGMDVQGPLTTGDFTTITVQVNGPNSDYSGAYSS